MKKYVAIGIGGLAGACLRASLKNLPALFTLGSISINVLLINLIGCFILSFFTTLVLDSAISLPLKLGISTGFCGALTTFSTLCKEGSALMTSIGFASGILYLFCSVATGLSAIYLGEWVAGQILRIPCERRTNP